MTLLRTAIIGAGVLAFAWILLASRGGAVPGPADGVVERIPGTVAAPETGVQPSGIVSAPALAHPIPEAPAVDALVAEPVATRAPERAIRAASPAPTGGKPVAPVDLSWDIAMATDGSRAFHGSISATTRSGPARITATLTGVGGAVVTSAGSFVFPAVPAGQRLDLPVAGLAAAGPAAGGVTVTVTYTTSDTRGRAVRIDLRDPAERVTKPKTDSEGPVRDPAQPLQGTRIVTDDTGGRTILQPSAPPPHR